MSRSKTITTMAILVAIGVVVNILSFQSITFFGRISFVYVYCFITGIIMGGVKGAIVVSIADLIQVLTGIQGGPFVPQLTLSNAMMAMMAGIVHNSKLIKSNITKITIIGAFTLVVCSSIVAASGEAWLLYKVYPYGLAKMLALADGVNLLNAKYLQRVYYIGMSKFLTQSLWITINCIVLYFMYPTIMNIKKFILKQQITSTINIADQNNIQSNEQEDIIIETQQVNDDC